MSRYVKLSEISNGTPIPRNVYGQPASWIKGAYKSDRTNDTSKTIGVAPVNGGANSYRGNDRAAEVGRGGDRIVPVLRSALEELKTVNAGDKVTLTCQDNEEGAHEGVIAIRLAQVAP